jgi:hypothetical protein
MIMLIISHFRKRSNVVYHGDTEGTEKRRRGGGKEQDPKGFGKPLGSAQFTCDRIGAADKELIALHNCGHVITVDAEWERVAEETCRFIADHT